MSRCWIWEYLNIEGNTLYNSFSARVSFKQAMDLLSWVLPSPDNAPFNASYNFFTSSSILSLASSSSLFRSSSLTRSYSSRCLRYSSSCYGVLQAWGQAGTWGYYQDIPVDKKIIGSFEIVIEYISKVGGLIVLCQAFL